MIRTYIKILQKPPGAAAINKQLDFGTAVGLTKNAKRGQTGVVGATKGTFTTRGAWFEQQNKFGIRVKSATPKNLAAEIRTNADWLQKQKEGGHIPATKDVRTFHYRYNGVRYIAVPLPALRPKGSTKVLSRPFWASTIRKKKGTFVVKSKSGNLVVMNRFGPGHGDVVALFTLISEETIKPKDTFYKPIQNQVDRYLGHDISEGIEFALRTAK
jgi:hypothetical protein